MVRCSMEDAVSCCGPSNAYDLKTEKPDYLELVKGEDMYQRSLKSYYFPFLLKYHRHVCFLWLAIFVVSIVFGPSFLGLTKSDLDLPAGTSSQEASQAFKQNYPDRSQWPPSFIVADSTSGSSVVGKDTRDFDRELTSFVSENNDIIAGKTSYYDYISDRNLSFLAPSALSSDNRTMVFTINFATGATINTIKDTVTKLQKLASKQSYPGIAIGCTGLDALFNDLSTGAALAFELIDAVVLPIALFILGCNLRSYRHVLVAIVSLGCTLLLALAILVPIANTATINPFAPSILLTLGIAVCFDYSLFMLSRYREEVIVNMKSKDEAVFSCLLASGHVVLLSGFTLFVTFALLIAFPQNFLTSVGIGCGTIICTAVLANMTVTPALLLTFDCLMKFDACPSLPLCCKRLCCNRAPTTDETIECGMDPSKPHVESERNIGTEMSRSACQSPGEPATPRFRTSNGNFVIEDAQLDTKKQIALQTPRLFWFHIAYFGAKRPYLTMLIAFAVTVPFAIQWSKLKATSDNNVVFLRGSPSLKFLHILADAFPIGAIDPYQVVMTTGKPQTVNTLAYFETESNLIRTLLEEQSAFIDTGSISALSFFNGEYVDFSTSQSYLTRSSPVYGSVAATRYRTVAGSLRNTDNSATLILIQTIVDPDAEGIVPFILRVRSTLKRSSILNYDSSVTLSAYLNGGYCSTYDIQVIMYELYPVMIGSTIAIVFLIIGVSFGSILLPLRLILTVAISLCWTYGFLVIVYQPGSGRDAFIKLNPVLASSSGIYYLIPIMSFSILVGLAMDYDIFLMCRVLEFRQMGWSDRASVCLAVEKTGNVISAAGLIMSISFAGLLLPQTTVLNQFGFVLFIGVAIDTFIVRTVIVPAAVTAFSFSTCWSALKSFTVSTIDVVTKEDGVNHRPQLSKEPLDDGHEKSIWRGSDSHVNWWPYIVPRVVLSASGEEEALWAGYNDPADYVKDLIDSESLN